MGNERMILSPDSLAGGWESLDGSPDFYIFRDSSGDYRLLAYSLDAEYGRGSFSLYRIDGDGEGCHISVSVRKSAGSCRRDAPTPSMSWGGADI